MGARYFAYGSNLSFARMAERVPEVRTLGMARLSGYRLVCDKRGVDGSGKANLHSIRAGEVWGVVYAFDVGSWSVLDGFERGYERVRVRVDHGGHPIDVSTYRSDRVTTEPIPFDWYKRLIVEGAREHGLPSAYRRILEALSSRHDPAR